MSRPTAATEESPHRPRCGAWQEYKPKEEAPRPHAAWKDYAAEVTHVTGGIKSAYLGQHIYSLREKVEMLPRVLPFVILLMVLLLGFFLPPVSIILCCFFPGIATVFPDAVMGVSSK